MIKWDLVAVPISIFLCIFRRKQQAGISLEANQRHKYPPEINLMMIKSEKKSSSSFAMYSMGFCTMLKEMRTERKLLPTVVDPRTILGHFRKPSFISCTRRKWKVNEKIAKPGIPPADGLDLGVPESILGSHRAVVPGVHALSVVTEDDQLLQEPQLTWLQVDDPDLLLQDHHRVEEPVQEPVLRAVLMVDLAPVAQHYPRGPSLDGLHQSVQQAVGGQTQPNDPPLPPPHLDPLVQISQFYDLCIHQLLPSLF